MANGLILPDFAGRFNAGQDRAVRNNLLKRDLAIEDAERARAEQTRNLLAQYTMPGATPEEREANLNRLMAVNPDAAMAAQTHRNAQTEFANAQTTFQQQQDAAKRSLEQERAQQVVRRMQRVLASPNPDVSLRLNGKFDGGDLVEQLAQMGVVDPSDGIDAEEARRIAQLTIDQMAPIAGLGAATNDIGTYNPRDYTTDSWAQFIRTGDPSVLERYESFGTVDLGGGRKGVLDRTTGQVVAEPVSADEFQAGVRDTKAAAATGTAQGSAQTAAAEQFASLSETASQLERLFADPNFAGAVGPLDAITGRIGEWMGTEEGVLGGEVQRLTNKLVTDAVSAWKGAISEKELQFFKESVPGRGSSPATWKHWYEFEFLPRLERVKAIRSGQAFQPASDDALPDVSKMSDEELRRLAGGG